jgi:hypothetical protein
MIWPERIVTQPIWLCNHALRLSRHEFAMRQFRGVRLCYIWPMLLQLAVSTLMVVVTVIAHGLGLTLLSRMVRIELREEMAHHLPPLSSRGLFFTLALVLGIFALHGTGIWLYALLYVLVGAIPQLETAVYFSTISYAGIGYDDRYIEPAWRLVAAIEGINGLLLLGWSTAFFVTLIRRLGR